jgi:hypothetical protein
MRTHQGSAKGESHSVYKSQLQLPEILIYRHYYHESRMTEMPWHIEMQIKQDNRDVLCEGMPVEWRPWVLQGEQN